MNSNSKVIRFLSVTYNRILVSPLSFKYSIQATMNNILESNICSELKVDKISNDIFVDGNTFLNKITYLEDKSKYKYLAFHYDFIVGIKAKMFRIKELNLYTLDDNEYYSSSKNTYISLGFDLVDNYPAHLNHFLCIANRTQRIAILPKLRNSNLTPYYKSYIKTINIAILEKRFGKNYRVSTFLENIKVPLFINQKQLLLSNITSFDSLKSLKNQLIILSNNTFFSLNCIDGNYIVMDSQWQRNDNK